MTKSYQKECVYCKQEITMSDETGKWLPFNKDGSSHDCKTKVQQQEAKQEQQQQQEKPITVQQLKIWLARLEKNGIHIDINSIMNPEKQKQEEKHEKK